MTAIQLTVLAVGASGSIGRHVVDEALAQGHQVRALVRSAGKLEPRVGLEIVVGDLTDPVSLIAAADGVDAVVFTHGTYGSVGNAEKVDYAGVRNVLTALGGAQVRLALMTAIAVTDRKGAHDWKRRAERLVRVSGHPFTIVRPGWFDNNDADEMRLVFLQGDKRQSGTPRDGAVGRHQTAQVLVHSLTSEAAVRKTLELVTEHGAQQDDLDPLFAALTPDPIGTLDGAYDCANMPAEQEPPSIAAELRAIAAAGNPR